MQINFTGHQVEVTPALRQFAESKFDRLARYADNITSIQVIFGVEKLQQIAEATVRIPKADIHARAESEDMYTAVDALVDKLARQITKHKEKLRGN